MDLSDFAQLGQPVGCGLAAVLARSVPPSDLQRVTGACDETCLRCIDLPPCIVREASSLESHERMEFISLVLSKDYDAPLQNIVQHCYN